MKFPQRSRDRESVTPVRGSAEDKISAYGVDAGAEWSTATKRGAAHSPVEPRHCAPPAAYRNGCGPVPNLKTLLRADRDMPTSKRPRPMPGTGEGLAFGGHMKMTRDTSLAVARDEGKAGGK